MKISDLKPATVYRLTMDDTVSASGSLRSSRYFYGATGPEVELTVIEERSGYGASRSKSMKVTRVTMHPVKGLPHRFTSVHRDEQRRGLSIVNEVCSLDEARAYFRNTDATLAAQEAARALKASKWAEAVAGLEDMLSVPSRSVSLPEHDSSVRLYPEHVERLVALDQAALDMAVAYDQAAPEDVMADFVAAYVRLRHGGDVTPASPA